MRRKIHHLLVFSVAVFLLPSCGNKAAIDRDIKAAAEEANALLVKRKELENKAASLQSEIDVFSNAAPANYEVEKVDQRLNALVSDLEVFEAEARVTTDAANAAKARLQAYKTKYAGN